MRDPLSTYLRARPGSPLSELAEAALAREGELETQRDQGPEHALMAHAAELEAAASQLRLELDAYDTRGNVRLEVARYLESIVIPELGRAAAAAPGRAAAPPPALEEPTAEGGRRRRKTPLECVPLLPGKLREARRQCWFQMNLKDGGTRTIWDQKAGEPLLCPDDAREEAMRLQRRLEDKIEELARAGLRVYYGVLTIENAPAGGLAPRVAKLWRKFQRALKAKESPRRCAPAPRLHVHVERRCRARSQRLELNCRRHARRPAAVRRTMLALAGERVLGYCPRRVRAQRRIPKKELKPLFPVAGAIATLEAPLSASRTWHPHLNVILVTRGFFDFGTWWQHWGCVSDWRHLKPGNVEAAFRELIKYAVRAVPEKSQAKAAGKTTCNSTSLNSPGSGSGSSAPSGSGAWATAPDAPPDAWSPGTMDFKPGADPAALSGASSSSPSSARPPAPAMVQWSAAEWLEWWQAMKGRRRTRTYGELYGLNVEADEEEGAEWVTIGKGWWTQTGYRARFELLESIPGDKSISNIRTRWEKWLQGLTHPPSYYRELAPQVTDAREHFEFLTLHR